MKLWTLHRRNDYRKLTKHHRDPQNGLKCLLHLDTKSQVATWFLNYPFCGYDAKTLGGAHMPPLPVRIRVNTNASWSLYLVVLRHNFFCRSTTTMRACVLKVVLHILKLFCRIMNFLCFGENISESISKSVRYSSVHTKIYQLKYLKACEQQLTGRL